MEPSKERFLSTRVAKVPSSVMLTLADRIRKLESTGERIIDLSLGQPEVAAPPHISKAMCEALSTPSTSYSSSAGSAELRRLIAQDLTTRTGVDTNSKEIIVTSGSKHALFITLLSLVDAGQEVVTFEPFFPPYSEILGLIDGSLRAVPIDRSDDKLEPKVDDLLSAIGPKTRAVLLNYPNNPAGWTFSKEQVERIVKHCLQRNILVVSDEIYDQIVFDGREHFAAWSLFPLASNVIHIGSFSKTYSMVPFRLGFLAASSSICEEILKAQRATVTMVSPYVQNAGCAALSGPQDFVKQRLAKYQDRRDRCIRILEEAGMKCSKPSGAFYLFLQLPEEWKDAYDFASRFLEQHKVAVLPGGIFGERWKNYIRLSFATEDSQLYEAIQRLCRLSSARK